MLNSRAGHISSVVVAALTVVFAFSAITPAEAQGRKSIRWATAGVDTYCYMVAASTGKIVEEALGGQYTVMVNPYPSTTGAMKAAMNGDAEISYTADVGLVEVYEGTGAFKDFNPAKGKLVHTWYAYPVEAFMCTSAKDAGKYKSLADFSGKPVFFTAAGFMSWLNFKRVFKTLDYQFKHVQIDTMSVSDALQAGTIIGAVAYCTSGRSLVPFWKEAEIRMDVGVINPSPDEVKKLKAAGLAVVDIDPKMVFTKDVGVKTILGVPIMLAYNARADMPEDVVYKMVSAFDKNKNKLAENDAGFTPLARDFVGMQVQGIKANPQIPVHPGLARFLKEQKAWDDKWKISTASTK